MGLFKNSKSPLRVIEAELQTIYTESSWDEEVQNWLQNEIEVQQEEVDDIEMFLEEQNFIVPMIITLLGASINDNS